MNKSQTLIPVKTPYRDLLVGLSPKVGVVLRLDAGIATGVLLLVVKHIKH